jgi:hypothetical protein
MLPLYLFLCYVELYGIYCLQAHKELQQSYDYSINCSLLMNNSAAWVRTQSFKIININFCQSF